MRWPNIFHIFKLFLVALYANVACCMFLENDGHWFTSVMLGNKGNQYLIYFIIWDNGKSINKYYIEIQTLLFSPDSYLSRECQYLPLLKVLGKDCQLRIGNVTSVQFISIYLSLHDKIYLYRDVLISSSFSYYDGRYAQIYVYL
jgi:hypothetical protein